MKKNILKILLFSKLNMDKNKLTLYWYHGSQPSRAVKSLLLAAKIEHETKDVDIFKEE